MERGPRLRPLIERWLVGAAEARPLKLTKTHTLLARDHGLEASYDALWRFARQELAWREKPSTVRIDDPPPGQEAQVDFGKMGLMFDPETGRKRTLWALVVTFLDYVQARDLFVDPARVRSPKDKPRVANQGPFVRESWFDGETFTGIDHARASVGAHARREARARDRTGFAGT